MPVDMPNFFTSVTRCVTGRFLIPLIAIRRPVSINSLVPYNTESPVLSSALRVIFVCNSINRDGLVLVVSRLLSDVQLSVYLLPIFRIRRQIRLALASEKPFARTEVLA